MMFRLIKLIAAFVVVMALASCVTTSDSSAPSFDQGEKAFKTGDYKTAYQNLYPLAVDGRPDAQYAVGYMFYYGKGIAKNERIGESWIREAAVNGSSQAEQALELLTQKGMFNTETRG